MESIRPGLVRTVWRFIITLWAVLLGSGAVAHAQEVGNCEPAQAEAYLDVGNVRARIYNNGGLFWRFGSSNVYEVPKGSSHHAIFTASIWIGGLVEETVRMAASTYGPLEFWPGPLDADGNPPTDCSDYDDIYEIGRADIERYNESGVVSDNLVAWPWSLGAPVIDRDGHPDNYNLAGGDRPALIGDQMLWWVMNDLGNTHERTDVPPLGMEARASAYAFAVPGYIGNTTYYTYKMLYKGGAPLKSAYMSLFVDSNLGYGFDDYVGSDTTLDLGYTYNGDNDDDVQTRNYPPGYGPAPPALGVTMLESLGEDGGSPVRRRLSSFVTWYSSGGVTSEPASGEEMYLYMQSRWVDGQPFTLGEIGRDFSQIPICCLLPGDPVTSSFWSELNFDGNGYATPPSDREFVITTGPFDMNPGDEQEITFAIVWSRGKDHLDSVRQLKEDVRRLREVAPDILQPRVDFGTPLPVPSPELGFAQNYPNPFAGHTTIRYSLPQPMQVRLVVYDVLGREVATLVDERQEGGIHEAVFEAGDLPGGVYLYRIELDHLRFTKKMLLLR